METVHRTLGIIRWCVLALFLGNGVYCYVDYRMHPVRYAAQSAPWYLDIQLAAVEAALVLLVITLIMRLIKRRMR